MPRMGRPRLHHRDMPPGFKEQRYGWYWRATNTLTKEVLAKIAPGKSLVRAGRTKEEARVWWVKNILPLLDAATPLDDIAGTIEEILRKYEAEVIPAFRSEEGRREARRYVSTLRAKFGTRRYAKTEVEAMSRPGQFLTAVDVTQYLYENRERPVIANREIRALNKAFVLARRRWGLATYNPAAQAEYHTEEPRDVYVDDDTYSKIRGKGSPILQCMMDLAQMAGPRKGMIFNIRLGDDQGDILWLRPNKWRGKRPPKPYPAEITPDMREVLDRAKELRQKVRKGSSSMADLPTAHLFLTRAGKPYSKSSFARIWKTARTKAGIEAGEITFHDIRAKAGSDADSDDEAQELLRHQDRRTTRKVYRRKVRTVTPLPKVAKS